MKYSFETEDGYIADILHGLAVFLDNPADANPAMFVNAMTNLLSHIANPEAFAAYATRHNLTKSQWRSWALLRDQCRMLANAIDDNLNLPKV